MKILILLMLFIFGVANASWNDLEGLTLPADQAAILDVQAEDGDSLTASSFNKVIGALNSKIESSGGGSDPLFRAFELNVEEQGPQHSKAIELKHYVTRESSLDNVKTISFGRTTTGVHVYITLKGTAVFSPTLSRGDCLAAGFTYRTTTSIWTTERQFHFSSSFCADLLISGYYNEPGEDTTLAHAFFGSYESSYAAVALEIASRLTFTFDSFSRTLADAALEDSVVYNNLYSTIINFDSAEPSVQTTSSMRIINLTESSPVISH